MTRTSFSFIAKGLCETTGLEFELLCVFIDARLLAQHSFFDILTEALKAQPLLPDGVMVLADAGLLNELIMTWRNAGSSERESFLARGERGDVPFIKTMQFASWEAKGNLALRQVGDGKPHFCLSFDCIVAAGLANLVEQNPVVQIAPAGHAFKHPSGSINKVFLQARELASSEVELAFAARALVRALPHLADSELAIVYIDTMAIYPLVREALSFVGKEAAIQSFHSYDDVSSLLPPMMHHVVIISASTSGGMAKRLVETAGFSADRVATLVDMRRTDRRGQTLFALEDVDSPVLAQFPGGAETRIELTGEHFSFRSKPPRDVTLSVTHSPKSLAPFLRCVGSKGTHDLNTATSRRSRLISFNGRAVVSSSDFKKWLREEIAWHFSGAIDLIVAVDDNGSKELAELCAQIIGDIRGQTTRISVVSADQLTSETVASAQGVAVVQAVAGDGAVMREVSRDLREYIKTDVPRHFLVGLAAPQTAMTWERLKQFLERNTTDRDYGFSTWLTLPLGLSSATSAWEVYRKLASALQTVTVSPEASNADDVAASLERAVALIDSSWAGFLPALSGKRLELTEGFVFFPTSRFTRPDTSEEDRTAYLAIAAVLQSARDQKSTSPQLKATSYESVVLSPENFSRFNDNILQACLLRAALPSELDYSSSPELSGLMRELIAKIFDRRHHSHGAAALEFALALLSGRMRLMDSDLIRLREETLTKLAADNPINSLLGLVHLLDQRASLV